MSDIKVAIVGGGLAAAYAFRACLDAGADPTVFYDQQRPVVGGNIWCHVLPASVGGASEWGELIQVTFVGNAEAYSRKMWGRYVQTSFPKRPHTVLGVAPVLAARALWGEEINSRERLISRPFHDEDIVRLIGEYTLVIQTFSKRKDHEERELWQTPLWIMPDKMSLSRPMTIYDGVALNSVVRESALFGWRTYEMPPVRSVLLEVDIRDDNYGFREGKATLKHAPEIPPGMEPIRRNLTDAYWLRNNVLCVGRYATWDRKMLSHEAYSDVRLALETLP